MKYFLMLLSLATFACGKTEKTTTKKETQIAVVADTKANQEPTVAKVVDVPEFESLIKNKNVLLVDVRTPQEYQAGHIEGAKSLNFFDDDFKKQLSTLDKNQAIAVYCKSGHRSGKTREMLKQMGFKTVYDLKGGYLNWAGSHK